MGTTISIFIAENFFWVLVAVLALNLFQRKYSEKAQKKRFATLYWAMLVFGLLASAVLILEFGLSDPFLLIYIAAAAILVYFLQDKFLPFSFKCKSCGKTLSFQDFFYHDSNLCESCRKELLPEEQKTEEESADEEEDEEEEDDLDNEDVGSDQDDLDENVDEDEKNRQ